MGLAHPKKGGQTEKSRPIQAIKWKPGAGRFEDHHNWCKGDPGARIKGSQQDGNTRYVPYVYRRLRYLREQQIKMTLRRHLELQKTQWEKKEQRRTVTAQLLAHMMATRDGTIPPHVVVSILLCRWGKGRTPGSYKSINALEWQQSTNPNRDPKHTENKTTNNRSS